MLGVFILVNDLLHCLGSREDGEKKKKELAQITFLAAMLHSVACCDDE